MARIIRANFWLQINIPNPASTMDHKRTAISAIPYGKANNWPRLKADEAWSITFPKADKIKIADTQNHISQ